MKYAIEIKNLTKSYGKHRGVIDVDLNVKEGEWFGFIGPNGAGKSTTIRTLLGLIKPTKGECSVNGKDSWKMREIIMEDVGYLPSEAIFYPEMTVKDTLDYALSFFKGKDNKKQKELCERFQLDQKRKIGELSYGNRKKVGIVASLQHSPSILILDEPTGGLDPLMQREFFNILEEENGKGKTIFMSSHILSEIEHHAETAAFIRDGRIILREEVAEIANNSARRVSLRGKVDLKSLNGVKEMQENKDGISFLYSGESMKLLDTLSKGNIKDFTVTEPDLEEVFLHYYKKEER
ncbi:MAG: ATP-binding cassette domain-containing protein [Candidatus Ornithospirochaeta sp.]